MSPHLHTHKRVSPAQSPAGDWVVSPKRMLFSHQQKKIFILDLPEQFIHQIFSHSNLNQLGIISQVCKQFNKFIMSFLHDTSSIHMLFPSMTMANFRQLGIMVKKLTCLLTTRERVMVSTHLMSRLSPCSTLSTHRNMMALCGVFLHQMVKGWPDEEVVLTARLIFNTFNSGGSEGSEGSMTRAVVMDPNYNLGSRPEMEMHVRNFLSSFYGQERLWLQTLLLQVPKDMKDITRISLVMSKVILLISSPAKEQDWQFGVQWADLVDSFPTSYSSASARYSMLVSLLSTIEKGQLGFMIPSILFTIFQTPSPWLPENMGSVLLLLGHQTCYLYMQHTIMEDVANSCFKNISTAVIGLALMSARFSVKFTFGRTFSFGPVFDRLDEVVMQVPGVQREDFFRAIWKALAEEVTDIRRSLSIGEDWAVEGSRHLFKVIRLIGQKMTEKAFKV